MNIEYLTKWLSNISRYDGKLIFARKPKLVPSINTTLQTHRAERLCMYLHLLVQVSKFGLFIKIIA